MIPFEFDAPPVRVDVLDNVLLEAHRALPEAISIGHWLTTLPEEHLYKMVERIQRVTGEKLDGRLVMQYTLYTLCAQEVIWL